MTMSPFSNEILTKTLQVLPEELQNDFVLTSLTNALAEDLSPTMDAFYEAESFLPNDITSDATMPENPTITAMIKTKQSGVIAGLPVARAIFQLADQAISFKPLVTDGTAVAKGTIVAEITGPSKSMLLAERPALNFLGRMSGIASLTNEFVIAVNGTGATILDTRKTAPGLRHFDKCAVRMGGGSNHRMGLHDMVLIKDNHIDAAGGITNAVNAVREKYANKFPIEVEVKDLAELQEALALDVDRIMLDNMSNDTMREAVEITAGKTKLEASGNVDLERIKGIAETGVDFISIGALTHSVKVFDFSMRLKA